MGLKFNCFNAGCRARIEVADTLAGTEVPCPKCGTSLRVPKSHDIRFTCHTQGCSQHLLVDVSDAGRFVKCPSCGRPQRVPGAPPKSLYLETKSACSPLEDQRAKTKGREKPSPEKWRKFKYEDAVAHAFFLSSLLLLLLLGLAKIGTWRWKPWYPDGTDLVFNVPLNKLMPVLGVMECGVAVMCARMSSVRNAAALLLWFGFNWGVLRAGQYFLGQHRAMPALGAIGKTVGISDATADMLMLVFVVALCAGSSLIVWRHAATSDSQSEKE